jgi:riboflavin kinase/FMN adenylyltransferase
MSKIKIFTDYKKISKRFYNSSLVIGNFDGVHRGHKKVIQLAKNISKKNQLQLGVMMFDPHPREYFSKEKRFLLSSLDNKYEILEKLGVNFIVILKFNKLLASMSALAFCNKILLNGCKMNHVFIGKNFRFGQNRAGNLKYLANFGKNNGFKVTGSELYKVNRSKKIFSSSSIREFIKKGKIKEANKFLGHAWSVSGRVITGDKRGRLIGFPTANISTEKYIYPKFGVYAVKVIFLSGKNKGKEKNGIANFGLRPTFGKKTAILEVHLFSFKLNIYKTALKVSFIDYVRSEKKFSGIDSLKDQIKRDIVKAKKILNKS